MEDKKSSNFIRLAENRTNKILDMLNLLGNLSNKSNYTYTDEQVKLIFETIEKEVASTKEKFLKKEVTKKKKFRL